MAANLRKKTIPAVAAACLALAGCVSTDFGRSSRTTVAPVPQPAPSVPVQTATVQTTELPPIDGATGSSGLYDPTNQTATGSDFVSIDAVGATTGSTPGGRDLSGPLSMEMLLGGWTVAAGAEQCRLNLTYTAKGATGRYRASTPACGQPTLATVTSWQLLGNQIQLYNEGDELVGTLLRSGDRFVGTLAGGQSISMVG